MEPGLKSFALFLALASFTAVAQAAWVLNSKKDAMTDQVVKSARVTNEQGHSLTLYRQESGPVWATFALSDRSAEVLSSDKGPIYRIDKGEPEDLAELRRLQGQGITGPMYAWEPKWVNWLVWHGEGYPSEPHGTLARLMSGRIVVVRYFLMSGGYRESRFDVSGGKQVISRALSLDPKSASRPDEFGTAVANLTTVCASDLPKALACLDKLKQCQKSAAGDAKALKSCFASGAT